MRRKRHEAGKPQRGRWSVILRGQRGGDLSVPPQVHTYPSRRQARNVSRAVQNSRVAGPRSRGGCLARLLLWGCAIALVLLGIYVLMHPNG